MFNSNSYLFIIPYYNTEFAFRSKSGHVCKFSNFESWVNVGQEWMEKKSGKMETKKFLCLTSRSRLWVYLHRNASEHVIRDTFQTVTKL